jgi:putative restriction endonuclease
MTRKSVLHLFDKLNVWSQGDQRAPHKPLLVLYALGQWSRGETANIPFKQVNAALTVLLKEFGPRGIATIPSTRSGGCNTIASGRSMPPGH